MSAKRTNQKYLGIYFLCMDEINHILNNQTYTQERGSKLMWCKMRMDSGNFPTVGLGKGSSLTEQNSNFQHMHCLGQDISVWFRIQTWNQDEKWSQKKIKILTVPSSISSQRKPDFILWIPAIMGKKTIANFFVDYGHFLSQIIILHPPYSRFRSLYVFWWRTPQIIYSKSDFNGRENSTYGDRYGCGSISNESVWVKKLKWLADLHFKWGKLTMWWIVLCKADSQKYSKRN